MIRIGYWTRKASNRGRSSLVTGFVSAAAKRISDSGYENEAGALSPPLGHPSANLLLCTWVLWSHVRCAGVREGQLECWSRSSSAHMLEEKQWEYVDVEHRQGKCFILFLEGLILQPLSENKISLQCLTASSKVQKAFSPILILYDVMGKISVAMKSIGASPVCLRLF